MRRWWWRNELRIDKWKGILLSNCQQNETFTPYKSFSYCKYVKECSKIVILQSDKVAYSWDFAFAHHLKLPWYFNSPLSKLTLSLSSLNLLILRKTGYLSWCFDDISGCVFRCPADDCRQRNAVYLSQWRKCKLLPLFCVGQCLSGATCPAYPVATNRGCLSPNGMPPYICR